MDTHIADKVAHLTKQEHDKLTELKEGGEPNQNAFARVNGLEAVTTSDEFTIVGDVGVDVTTNPLDKSIHLTVNGESTPGKHGVTHDIGGSDPIPGLAQAVIDATDAKTKATQALAVVNAAETPTGAQDKCKAARVCYNGRYSISLHCDTRPDTYRAGRWVRDYYRASYGSTLNVNSMGATSLKKRMVLFMLQVIYWRVNRTLSAKLDRIFSR